MKNSWEKLRKEVCMQSEAALKQRLKDKPVPSELECNMGAFIEELEYQVRDAVVAMNKKGYTTDSSGFYGAEQVIDGEFELPRNVINSIEKLGARVNKGKNWTEIRFLPQKQDLKEIKETWDRIVGTLPDKGQLAVPSTTAGAEDFRKKYKKCHMTQG